MTQAFLSYAHADRQRLDQCLIHLKPVLEEMKLRLWWDNDLKGGQEWHPRIQKAITDSDLFICLVTPAFVASDYIREHELPAICEMWKTSGTLVLPLYVEACRWQTRFGIFRTEGDITNTPLHARPQDKKGNLKPVIDWSPHRRGWHEAVNALAADITAFLNAQPKAPDTGLMRMQPTEGGFQMIPGGNSDTSPLTDPQKTLIDDLKSRLSGLRGHYNRLHNCAPRLSAAIKALEEALNKDAVNWTKMWMVGVDLGAEVHDLREADLGGALDETEVSALCKDIRTLSTIQGALVMSHPDGVRLTSDAMAATILSQPERKAAIAALAALIKHTDLYERETHALGRRLLESMAGGTTDASRVAEALGFTLSSLAGMAALLEPEAKKAIETAKPVDPAALSALEDTSLKVLTEEDKPLMAFSRTRPELRRYVPWLRQGLQGKRPKFIRPAPLKDKPFDEDAVRDMILRGVKIPSSWVFKVKNLIFRGKNLPDPSILQNFPNLEVLDLSETDIINLVTVSKLRNIRYLFLTSTPVNDLIPISNLSNIHGLYFGGTEVVDISPIAKLINIQALSFWGTKVSKIDTVAELANLEDLFINLTQVNDLMPIAGLAKLRCLLLGGTLVRDLRPLNGLNLKELDLEGLEINHLPDTWPTGLEAVNLFNCRWPEGALYPTAKCLITPDGETLGAPSEGSWIKHVHERILSSR